MTQLKLIEWCDLKDLPIDRHYNTFHNWILDGVIPSYCYWQPKPGGKYIIFWDKLREYLERGE